MDCSRIRCHRYGANPFAMRPAPTGGVVPNADGGSRQVLTEGANRRRPLIPYSLKVVARVVRNWLGLRLQFALSNARLPNRDA